MNPTPASLSADAQARERIRTALDETLIVEASAGTGKTTELVNRVVALLGGGRAKIGNIVAVTFTHKAAGELKLRLRQKLDEARRATADPHARRSIEDALEHLEEAFIGTIHSFCAQILRERPVEARIDPAFEELTELENARIYNRAFRQWLEEMLAGDAPGLKRAFARLALRQDWSGQNPADQLKFAGRQLIEWRDFDGDWMRPDIDLVGTIDQLVELATSLADVARKGRPSDVLTKALRPIVEFDDWRERAERSALERDYVVLESLLCRLPADLSRAARIGKGSAKSAFAEDLSREEVVDQRDRLIVALDRFRQAAEADMVTLLYQEMASLVSKYEDAKLRTGRLDFLDLLLLARNLVRDCPEVRKFLQGRYTHIFIDEFQDTDPLQAELFLLLAADDPDDCAWETARPKPGKLFVVGDPKQSIYRFRRADVTLYNRIRDNLIASGARLVRLSKSYRSLRPVQQLVNAAFAREMTEASGQAEYAPLEEHRPAWEDQPQLVALPVPNPYGDRNIRRDKIAQQQPELIAAFVEWLVRESGWTVEDPETQQRVPLQARHVALLFRRFRAGKEDLSRNYSRALEARGLSHLLVGSKSYYQREEIESLRAALTAIEWPEDELSVFATLKGSLFALSDALLLRFRTEIGHFHPFVRWPDPVPDDFAPVREALDVLKDLHRSRNGRPFADTVNALLESARAHAGYVFRPGGHQVLANVQRVADLARQFELSGGTSFRGFVEEMESQAERAETEEAPVLEEGADGVLLMSVHKAKGLEFPVVILADMTTKLFREAGRYVDPARGICAQQLLYCSPWELIEHQDEETEREHQEGVRVAYVAATRARDLLVVPTIGDEPQEGWFAPLNKALYPSKDQWRKSRKAPGTPEFGAASVLNRPLEHGDGEYSVRPGLHEAAEGGHPVVWWDPSKLNLRQEDERGISQIEILGEGPAAADSIANYAGWQADRAAVTVQGANPSREILLAAKMTTPPDFDCTVDLIAVDREAVRPSGRRFGTLVHGILRDAPLDATPAVLDSLAKVHARVLGAPPEEVKAASKAAANALAHPLIVRALAAERIHREYPVMVRLDNKRILEGVIDLAFLDKGQWHIVDFKTDADVPAARDRYEVQLQWYAFAMSTIMGEPVRAWLLAV
ncbi:MAG: UvrD-helicase domain-containing protein [Bryobacteraceae bacterium]